MKSIEYNAYLMILNSEMETVRTYHFVDDNKMSLRINVEDTLDQYPFENREGLFRLDFYKEMKCHCGESVYLVGFTCQCGNCGQYYNSAGQELCDPEYWGEETGESIVDIYNGYDY